MFYTRHDYFAGVCSKQQYYSQFVNENILIWARKYYTTIKNTGDFGVIIFYIRSYVDEELLIRAQEGWSSKTGMNITEAAINMI